MDHERYRQVKRRFLEACGLGPGEREAFIAKVGAEDPELAAAVEALLRHDSETRASGPRRQSANGGATGGGEGDRIGPFRILELVGRGGQGIVYLAEDERLHRKVALKVLTGWGLTSEAALKRFRREAEVASKLDHPGICTVYDAGVEDGVPYIAMRYVEGETLARKLSTARESAGDEATSVVGLLEFEAAASTRPEVDPSPTPSGPTTHAEVMRVVRLVEEAARALHAAHESGVIHRDIKPGNIMVTAASEPVILDFGLARELEGDLPTLTHMGELFGTPAYMSPEQLAHQRIRLDRRTDVWSLGVTLYECLSLRRPFDTPTHEATY
jgi:serine/threonine protein kinase